MRALDLKAGIGAIAAMLALTANAQTSTWPPRGDPGQQPPAGTPPTAPAPTTQPAPPRTTTPPAPTSPTSPAATPTAQADAKAAIESVHDFAVRSKDVGKVVAEKATSPKLKQLGSQLVQDHTKIEQEATQLAQERGIQLTPAEKIIAGAPHQGGMKNTQAAPGPEMDRALSQMFASERASMVTTLKQLRDKTPGKDAKLKKWLDDVENTLEKESSLAYAARSEVNQQAQRQGRTPPAQ